MQRNTVFGLGIAGIGLLAIYLGMTNRVDDFVRGVKNQCQKCPQGSDTGNPPGPDSPGGKGDAGFG